MPIEIHGLEKKTSFQARSALWGLKEVRPVEVERSFRLQLSASLGFGWGRDMRSAVPTSSGTVSYPSHIRLASPAPAGGERPEPAEPSGLKGQEEEWELCRPEAVTGR